MRRQPLSKANTVEEEGSIVDSPLRLAAGAAGAPEPAGAGKLIETVGSLAAVCTTFAFVPQAWSIIITGDTAGLSLVQKAEKCWVMIKG